MESKTKKYSHTKHISTEINVFLLAVLPSMIQQNTHSNSSNKEASDEIKEFELLKFGKNCRFMVGSSQISLKIMTTITIIIIIAASIIVLDVSVGKLDGVNGVNQAEQ